VGNPRKKLTDRHYSYIEKMLIKEYSLNYIFGKMRIGTHVQYRLRNTDERLKGIIATHWKGQRRYRKPDRYICTTH
jgi:hypothetical protein